MSQQIELNYNPPRIPTVPMTPLPQTCMGVLEHTGLPYAEPMNVTDIPPDFGWMTSIQTYEGSFTYSKEDVVSKVIWHSNPLTPGIVDPYYLHDLNPTWPQIPFAASKWWNGTISYKFVAIKPPRVAGKLILRFWYIRPRSLLNEQSSSDPDSLMRGIAKEWDLAQTNIFEFDITALNPIQARPTWLPIINPKISGFKNGAQQSFSWAITSMGYLTMQAAQRLQVGSIFPDSIRIFVFRTFKNAQFYTPTDMRSRLNHCLGVPRNLPVHEMPSSYRTS